MEKEVNPPTDFFKGIKTSLKSVLKHPDINLPKITNAVIKCNKIVIQTIYFSLFNRKNLNRILCTNIRI